MREVEVVVPLSKMYESYPKLDKEKEKTQTDFIKKFP